MPVRLSRVEFSESARFHLPDGTSSKYRIIGGSHSFDLNLQSVLRGLATGNSDIYRRLGYDRGRQGLMQIRGSGVERNVCCRGSEGGGQAHRALHGILYRLRTVPGEKNLFFLIREV
jgi:hypothetical protein